MSSAQNGPAINQKNRISFMLGNNQRMDNDKKQLKPSLAGFGGGARLDQALGLDSDEEDIVNMDTI